jgi:hypothetical protein
MQHVVLTRLRLRVHLRRCEGLANELSQLLHAYKESLSSQGRWEAMAASLEPMVRSKLQQVYNL